MVKRGLFTASLVRAAMAGALSLLMAWPSLLMFSAILWLAPAAFNPAWAAPQDGKVVSGQAGIGQDGKITTITQTSDRVSINWRSFGIAADETVQFKQPSAGAIALNRVIGNDPSQIFGRLNANGRVYLINPNGILFGSGAQVNVAGLVASTLDIDDDSLNKNKRRFAGNSKAAVTVEQGARLVADGGELALLGHQVINQGTIMARLGTVALGGGNDITLDFNGDRLLSLLVNRNELNAQARNGGLIQADGGLVLMSAGARDSLLASVVNNSGIIQAQSVQEREGKIVLLAGMAAGSTEVSGTLDASAPLADGSNGGFIETSGSQVKVADGARITTRSASGKTGLWLIDPTDFTIAASGGDMTGETLAAQLANSNVEIQSTNGGSGSSGNIYVNDALRWSSGTGLTLNAINNIYLNGLIDASQGNGGRLVLKFGQGNADGYVTNQDGSVSTTLADYYLGANGRVNLQSGSNFRTVLGDAGTQRDYNVITTLAELRSSGSSDFVLGDDIEASATASDNFNPLGLTNGRYVDGLGNTISNLVINSGSSDVGLFSVIGANSRVSNLGLRNVKVSGGGGVGNFRVGALAGTNNGRIRNSFVVEGTVLGIGEGDVENDYSIDVGGLIGLNNSLVQESTAQVTVRSESAAVGNSVTFSAAGLIGRNSRTGVITNSSASGDVEQVAAYGSIYAAGGLVGSNQGGSIAESSASGTVNGVDNVGGLIGYNANGVVRGSFATASVGGTGSQIGGLIGTSENGQITDSYATGSVSGVSTVGGLVGYSVGAAAVVSNSYATGSVSGSGSGVGGLVGANRNAATIQNSYAMGAVTGLGTDVGALVGFNNASITNSYYSLDSSSINGATPRWSVQGLSDALLTRWKSNAYALDSGWFFNQSGDGYFAIDTATKLRDAAYFATRGDYKFRLTADIDAGSDSLPENFYFSRFSAAEFDGGGFRLSHYRLNLPDADNLGLFGVLGAGSKLSNWMLVDASVTGRNQVGALVGYNEGGSITGSSASGAVSGVNNVGGLVGYSVGAVSGSYATGSVVGTGNQVGGLVGNNEGQITDSYATGAVSGGSSVGGLVGYSLGPSATVSDSYATGLVTGSGSGVGGLVGANRDAATIRNSYATGAVTGLGTDVGALVGDNNASITNSYYSLDSSGTNPAVGSGSLQYRAGLSNDDFKRSSAFGGFDFSSADSPWVQYEGYTAPLLRSFMKTLGLTGGSKVYNGKNDIDVNSLQGETASGSIDRSKLLGSVLLDGKDADEYQRLSGLYSDQQGYWITYAPNFKFTINKAEYTTTSLTGSKTYNGDANFAGLRLEGVNGETFSANGVANSKNAWEASQFSSVTDVAGNAGADSRNYNSLNLAGLATNRATINKAEYTTTSLSGSKTYNGDANFAGLRLEGVNGETFSASGVANSKNAWEASQFSSVTDVAGNAGADSRNYNNLNLAVLATNRATISTAKYASLKGSKTYDGTARFNNVRLQGVGEEFFTLDEATSEVTTVGAANRFVAVSGAPRSANFDSRNYQSLDLSDTALVNQASITAIPVSSEVRAANTFDRLVLPLLNPMGPVVFSNIGAAPLPGLASGSVAQSDSLDTQTASRVRGLQVIGSGIRLPDRAASLLSDQDFE